MPDDRSEGTQRTREGAEIPVPTREQFMRDLRKASEPDLDVQQRQHAEGDRQRDTDDGEH